MKTNIFNRPWRASGAALTAALLLLATANLQAGVQNGVVVGSLCGGGASPFHGYVEGNPANSTDAEFYTPSGLAQDSTGEYLFVADRDNNKIRVVDLFSSPDFYFFTYTFVPISGLTPSGAISKPVGVALDAEDNVYVLNRGTGNNGTVLKFDVDGNLLATTASGLVNANAIALDAANNAYVSSGSSLIQITPAGVKTTIATVAGATLQGLVVMDSGLIAACDSSRNGICLINPTNHTVSNLTGFNGAGDNTNIWETTPDHPVTKTTAKFNYPTGLAKAGHGMLIVADYGNNRVKVVDSAGTVTNLYGVSSNLWYKGSGAWPGWWDGNVTVPDAVGDVEARSPNGVLFGANDTIYVTEDYYHLIRQVTGMDTFPPPPPAPTVAVSTNDCQISLTWSTSPGATSYNVKRSTSSSGPYVPIASTPSASYTDTSVLDGTTYYYVVSALGVGGEGFNSYPPVSATLPVPLPPTILSVVTNTTGQLTLTWSTSPCATSYNVERSPSTNAYTLITNTFSTSYTDTNVLAGDTYCYVIVAVGAGANSRNSAPWCVTVPPGQVPDPQIGYVDFPATSLPVAYTSVFHPVSSSGVNENNDVPIVIEGAAGSQTFYTYGPTGGSIPDPTSASASAPVGYQDGMSPSQVAYYTIAQTLPDLTIKAIGEKSDGSPNSAIAQARFQFVTGNPIITGNNAAQFAVSDITTNAEMWYTVDGSNPTNAAPSVGPVSSGTTLSLQFPAGGSNLTFKVIAFRANYQPSALVPVVFSSTNFVPNTISFGFASGEASSAFVGSPGQTFYAPVTLSTLPGTLMYSLQFNITVTNVGPAPNVTPGAYSFQSMLVKPVVPTPTNYPAGFDLYTPIPPYMYIGNASSPPPPSQIVPYYNGINNGFINLQIINSTNNLLGVGWLERYSETNLYNTLSQDLIQYSMAHDDLFPNARQPNGVIVGGYGFQIPGAAKPNEQYQIQIGLPSATDDGVGAPGSAVYIAAPAANTSAMGAGTINALKRVTVGQFKYLVGDAYPFGWFNAGDFGDTNLNNADVEQVFESAIYGLNTPPANTDFYNSMDSCGGILGGIDPSTGYYTNSGLSLPNLNALFNGNDASINTLAFGDGNLDVCDVYVTFRRSLDPSLMNFYRFWTNGMLEAQLVNSQGQPQVQASPAGTLAQPQVSMSFLTNPPSVNFAAADFTASAGQTVQIPITAKIFGNYPLRVLMLNLSVEPLDGSPALTSAVQFTPNAALGTAAMTSATGNGNYAATWLNSAIAGLTGTASLGTLTVTIPANAPSSAAYAIHFDHASASPNGIAPFPKQTLTGLILLSDRSSSSYGDGIPDSWRLRYFGTVNNVLSQAAADADGDGASNWQEYMAGTDPTDPKSLLRVSTDQAAAQQTQDCVIHWPSVAGKHYLIERSTSLYGPGWSPIATITGSGADMEFHDTTGGTVRFYRVQVTP